MGWLATRGRPCTAAGWPGLTRRGDPRHGRLTRRGDAASPGRLRGFAAMTATPRTAGPATGDRADDAAGMALVPGGTFLMGAEDFYPEERPVHRVTVDAFWMDRDPVTVAEFR